MPTSAELFTQLQQLGQMPDFRQQLTQAYEQPVLRPLVQEGAQLEAQYLPSLFQPFTQMGTGAADMSPAAKLAAVGESVGRLGSRIGANQSIQNYYGTQINDLASTLANQFKDRQGYLSNLYNLAFQREEAEKQRQLEEQRLAIARASAMPQAAPAFPSFEEFFGGAPDNRAVNASADIRRRVREAQMKPAQQAASIYDKVKAAFRQQSPGVSPGFPISQPIAQASTVIPSSIRQITGANALSNILKPRF